MARGGNGTGHIHLNRELVPEIDEDGQLVALVKEGQLAAFSQIVKKYQKGLLRLSLRFVKDLASAEDVTQESFLKAYEKIHSFEGRASFRSWLFQITVNTARNKLRERRDSSTDIDQVQISVPSVAEKGLKEEALRKLIAKSVETLPFRQRTALVLRIYEDLSFKEIAEVMECPYDTAKANYRHAILKLKDELEMNSDLRTWNSEEPIWTELKQSVLEVET